MGQGSKHELCSSRCPVLGRHPQSRAGGDVETHMDVPLLPPQLSPTKDETQQQSCQGNNIEKRQFKERELCFFPLNVPFQNRTLHFYQVILFCDLQKCRVQMKCLQETNTDEIENNWGSYGWPDPELLKGSRESPLPSMSFESGPQQGTIRPPGRRDPHPRNAHLLTPAKCHSLASSITHVPWQCAWPDAGNLH